MRLLFQFMVIAQSVVNKIALPVHFEFSGRKPFSVLYYCRHFIIARKRKNCVHVIRHQKSQTTMPDQFVVVVCKRADQSVAHFRTAQVILSRWHAFDSDKKPAACCHPLRDGVRQFLANGEIH
jgi:hypothetical protein